MSRVEEFKALRKHRQKCFMVILLFLFLSVSGLIIADNSVNNLMDGEHRIQMVEWAYHPDRTMTVHIFNQEVDLNLDKLIDDYETITRKFIDIFEKFKKIRDGS